MRATPVDYRIASKQDCRYACPVGFAISVFAEDNCLKPTQRVALEAHWILRTWRPSEDKFIVCRPHGGLNDALVQSSAAIRFAHRARRRLVLDLAHSSSGVRINADELFVVPLRAAAKAIDLGRSTQLDFPPHFSWSPSEARDLAYHSLATSDGPRTAGGSLLRLPPADVRQNVIVHETWGGGSDHVLALKALRLSQPTAAAVRDVVSRIPTPDFAVHLRFTDARVSIDDCLDRLLSAVRGSLFIASDSEKAIHQAQQALATIPITTLPQERSVDDRSIHSNGVTTSMFTALLSDIYLLSSARVLITCPLTGTPNWLSGITRLAQTFRASPSLRRSFFGF